MAMSLFSGERAATTTAIHALRHTHAPALIAASIDVVKTAVG
jgi:hypothetical protein